MSPLDLHEVVERIQTSFDISRLRLGGFNHWMLVKLLMLANLSHEASSWTKALIGASAHSRIIDNDLTGLESSRTRTAAYRVQSVGTSALIFNVKERPIQRNGFIFYELPTDYTQVIDGLAINRIADGFMELFGENVDKVSRYSHEVMKLRCRFDPIYIFLSLSELNLPYNEVYQFCGAVDELCAQIYETNSFFKIEASRVIFNAASALRQADAHKEWLERVAPKVVGFQCYASRDKIAVMMACKRLGIPTIEIQHGYCDAFSVFNNLPESTKDSVTLLPDAFWAWGPSTQASLMADEGFRKNGVKVIQGGDVWGTVASLSPDASLRTARFLDEVGAAKYQKRVLVGYQVEALLSSSDAKILVPKILTEAVAADVNWLWMFRVHPRSSHLIQPLEDFFRALGLENVEVRHSSVKPIEVVLDASDCFVTGFSVAAFEANYKHKPVVIIDKIGQRLFSREIGRGIFTYCETAAEIRRTLEDARSVPSDPPYYVRDVEVSQKAFLALLAQEAA